MTVEQLITARTAFKPKRHDSNSNNEVARSFIIMADDSQSISASVASSTTTQRGVRIHIKKQLAEDIESNGGIQHFAGNNQHLYHLLQSRIGEDDNPYGLRGDPIRTQLRAVVRHWLRKDKEGKYVSDILNPWRILQSSARMPRNSSRRQRSRSNDSVSSSSDDDSGQATAVRNPRPTSYSHPNNPRTPPKQVIVNAQPPPTTPLTPPLTQTFASMSVNDNKRKIGAYDIDTVSRLAGK